MPPTDTNYNVFIAGPPTYTVTGQISNVNASVSVVATIGTSTNIFTSVASDVNGFYSLVNLPANTYTIIPQPANGFTFSPPNVVLTVPPSTNAFFTALTSSGGGNSIATQVANVHVPVTVAVNSGSGNSFFQTSANGSLSLTNLAAGSYTITPMPTNGISFVPASRIIIVPPSTSTGFSGTTTNRPSLGGSADCEPII